MVHRLAPVDGAPGTLSGADGRPFGALSVDTDGARIHALHGVTNPDKLTRVPPPVGTKAGDAA